LDGKFSAVVNKQNRFLSASNHSATHLLHHALRTVLGTHVEQKGSLVNAKNLRFDFSHFSKVTDEELKKIETMVNDAIRANLDLNEKRNVPIETATEMGAMALFGEKYGDTVRVIQFGDSVELCGGTHIPSTGTIGLFTITTETAVAAGIRRIEAITNETAENFFRQKAATVDEIAFMLKNPKDLKIAIEDLMQKNQSLQKQVEAFQREKAQLVKHDLKAKIESVGGISLLTAQVELDAASIKDILFQLKSEVNQFVGIIGGKEGDKCSLNIIFDENLANEKGWNAGKLIRDAAKHIQGGGGGQAFFATAGGKNAGGLSLAIEEVKSKL
jgi:alanyl-tRNA synthetase